MLIIRHCQKTREWRWKIFTRDDFTCRLCGKRGSGNLHADHYPTTFAYIIRRYRIRTLEDAMKCKALWQTNNGRTLCEDCHRKRHGIKKVALKKAA
jgi:5-methylcytosine-specific restriction endonuclease McrA